MLGERSRWTRELRKWQVALLVILLVTIRTHVRIMKENQWKGGRSSQLHTLREDRGAILGAGVGVPVALVLCLLTAVGGRPVGFLAPAETPAWESLLAAALGPVLEVCLLSRGGC